MHNYFIEYGLETDNLDVEQIAEACIAAKDMGWSVNPLPKEEVNNG